MLQPAFLDCLLVVLLPHFQDRLSPALIDVSGRQVVEALVVTVVVAVIDEGADLSFQITGQEVVFQ